MGRSAMTGINEKRMGSEITREREGGGWRGGGLPGTRCRLSIHCWQADEPVCAKTSARAWTQKNSRRSSIQRKEKEEEKENMVSGNHRLHLHGLRPKHS